MISRNVVEQLANSVEVACEVLSNVSTEALIEMYGDALVDEPHPLDGKGIIEGLLAHQSSSLSLVLARFANLGHAHEHIIAVAEMSHAHKCALLSNPRIPWYSVGQWDEIKETLLVPVLLANDTSTRAFLRNPRAHRKLIALAIRGEGPFAGMPLEVRLNYAIEATGVEEISESWDSKAKGYGPTPYDFQFEKPIEALLAVLKAFFDQDSEKQRRGIAGRALKALIGKPKAAARDKSYGSFRIDHDDWLSADDRAQCEATDSSNRYDEERRRALLAVLEWTARLGRDCPLSRPSNGSFDMGEVGDLAVYVSLKAIRAVDLNLDLHRPQRKVPVIERMWSAIGGRRPVARSLTEQLRTSTNWVHRAGAIAAAFYNTVWRQYPAKKRVEVAMQFIGSQSHDAAACIRGLASSGFFWGMVHSSNEVRWEVEALSRKSPEAERALADATGGIFYYAYRGERDWDLEKH